MIRPPVPEDAKELARMGQAFFDGTPLTNIMDFDPASLFALIVSGGDSSQFYVYEENGRVGGAAGVIAFPHPFNNNVLIAQELFWWVDEEFRGSNAGKELYRGITEWAKSVGSVGMIMVAIENECVSRVERLYNHYGYAKLEHAYLKGL